MPQTIPLMYTSTSPLGVRDTTLVLVVVAAEGLAVDEGECGDDRTRMMPGAAEVGAAHSGAIGMAVLEGLLPFRVGTRFEKR